MPLIESAMPYPPVRRHSDLNTLDYLLLCSAMEIYHNTVPSRAEGESRPIGLLCVCVCIVSVDVFR